jgi:hypothetical protein
MENAAFGRLLAVLWAPAKTFTSIAARPTWLAAILALALLGAVAVHLGFSKVTEADLVHSMQEQGRELPPNASPEAILKFTRWAAVGGAALFAPALYVGVALLFWVTLRLLGSELDFVRSLAVTVHGFMPFAIAALVGIPVALGREEISIEELQGGQLVASHLGFLASEETGKATIALLTSVDLFSVWAIALLAIGYRVVAKVSRGAALGVVLGIWTLGVLLKVGLAVAFS